MSQPAAPENLNIRVFTQSGPNSDIRPLPSSDLSARFEIILPAALSVGECRSSGLARPRTPTARRVGPLLHDQPRAVGGQLQAAPIFFRTLSNPVSWNVASWPTPGQSNTLIFSGAPSGSDRRSPTASPL